jgi:hypothetical protein
MKFLGLSGKQFRVERSLTWITIGLFLLNNSSTLLKAGFNDKNLMKRAYLYFKRLTVSLQIET